MNETLWMIAGFLGLLAIFGLINWLHDRWAWRSSVREVEEMMACDRRSPPH